MKTIKFLLLAALMLTYTISTYGQDKSHYMPKFAIKTNALYWATTTIPGNSRITNKSSTGWYSLNFVTGCASASTDISSACTPIMQKRM